MRPRLSVEGGAGLRNPDFSQGLTGWTVDIHGGSPRTGSIAAVEGRAVLSENASFLVSLVQEFTLPAVPDRLSFDFEAIPGFDRGAGGMPDAFEVHLLDAVTLVPLVPSWDPLATSFFNMQEGGQILRGATTTWDGLRASVDLQHLQGGSRVILFVDLIGADLDEGSQVRVDNFSLSTCPGNLPPVLLSGPKNNRVKTRAGAKADFTLSFGDLQPGQEIARIDVLSGGLANFTFDPPVYGPEGSVTCHFQPSAAQITYGGTFHRVTIQAYDNCSAPLSVAADIDIEVCTCPEPAVATQFGTGWAGTLGVPALTATLPSACSTIDLQHENSEGVPSVGFMWIGLFSQSKVSEYGGTLYIVPTEAETAYHYAYPMPLAGGHVLVEVPCYVPELCGVVLYAQGFQLDAAATHGIAATNALVLTVGN